MTKLVEAKVYGYPLLHSEFKASLNYVSPFVASTNRRRKNPESVSEEITQEKKMSLIADEDIDQQAKDSHLPKCQFPNMDSFYSIFSVEYF